MKTKRSLDVGVLPVYMERAVGVDRSWIGRGKCRSSEHDLPRQAWTLARTDDDLQGIPAERWITLARTICESCAAQYDCVRFALQIDERYNTWGVDILDLEWLKKRDYSYRLVDRAEQEGLSVHQAVRRAQRHDIIGP